MSANDHGHGSGSGHDHGPSHYIKIWAVLLVLLIVSICGPLAGIRVLTLLTAFGIAIVKAIIVAREFMHLKMEKKFVSQMLLGMLVLVGIFYFGVAPDVMKQDGLRWVKTQGANLSFHEAVAVADTRSHLTNPWVTTPELIAHGKEVFSQNCVLCHGAEGKGDGVGGATLNPKPRNFTSGSEQWKNGRTVAGVFKTLKEGVAGSGMASFSGLPIDDRWSLIHYVLSLGPTKVPTPTQADLTKAGVTLEEPVLPSVPVDFAIARMTKEAADTQSK